MAVHKFRAPWAPEIYAPPTPVLQTVGVSARVGGTFKFLIFWNMALRLRWFVVAVGGLAMCAVGMCSDDSCEGYVCSTRRIAWMVWVCV